MIGTFPDIVDGVGLWLGRQKWWPIIPNGGGDGWIDAGGWGIDGGSNGMIDGGPAPSIGGDGP